jgi:hypothetical protein
MAPAALMTKVRKSGKSRADYLKAHSNGWMNAWMKHDGFVDINFAVIGPHTFAAFSPTVIASFANIPAAIAAALCIITLTAITAFNPRVAIIPAATATAAALSPAVITSTAIVSTAIVSTAIASTAIVSTAIASSTITTAPIAPTAITPTAITPAAIATSSIGSTYFKPCSAPFPTFWRSLGVL